MTPSAPGVPSTLIAQVQSRFQVGEHFARAYLGYWFRSRVRVFETLEQILAEDTPYPMWFEFAMSTNGRARALAEFLSPLVGTYSGRYLDVGCGFGGYLRAFADCGMEVVGIEVDPIRAALSRANAADGSLGECVVDLSVLDPKAPSRLVKFDLITCIDVIEHVPDAAGALRQMSAMLRPGGILAMEIPNKDSLRFVASDGHFGLSGLLNSVIKTLPIIRVGFSILNTMSATTFRLTTIRTSYAN